MFWITVYTKNGFMTTFLKAAQIIPFCRSTYKVLALSNNFRMLQFSLKKKLPISNRGKEIK